MLRICACAHIFRGSNAAASLKRWLDGGGVDAGKDLPRQ